MKLPRNADIWFGPYLKNRLRKIARPTKPKRAWVAITDHYEPLGMGATVETALGRVAQWREMWPRIAGDAPRDAAGQRPQYTFFYPQEEYRRDLLDSIAEMVRLGIADVEVHLHHHDEQRDLLIEKVSEYCGRLTGGHGLLRQQDGRTAFGKLSALKTASTFLGSSSGRSSLLFLHTKICEVLRHCIGCRDQLAPSQHVQL